MPTSTLCLEKILRSGPVESHLSIAPREGIDFFAKRDEYHLLFPVEIRIDEALQVTWETLKPSQKEEKDSPPLLCLSCSGRGS
jgi:hypothetical protein